MIKIAQQRDVFRDIARPGVIVSAVLLLLYLATVAWALPFPRDVHAYAFGRDFLNFWNYGREAWLRTPERFFDIAAYNRHLQALTGWNYPTQQWSYPPHLLLLAAPFGLLPYLPAYFLWTALGIAALYWTLPKEFRQARFFLMLVLAPAGFFCLISGQNAFFTAAIFIVIFRFLDTRPVLAGILLGLLTIKPQLALLFPLMLLLTGRWKAFVSATVTTLILIGASILIWGTEIWSDYFLLAVPQQEFVITHPTSMVMGLMPTLYMNARITGLSIGAAYALQSIVAVMAAAAVVWTYRRKRDPLLSYALLIVAGFLVTPYLMSYDLVIAGWLIVMLWAGANTSAGSRALLMAFYMLPFITMAFSLIGLPGSALVLVGVACWLMRLMMREAARAPNASPFAA